MFRDTAHIKGGYLPCNHERCRDGIVKIDVPRENPWFIGRKKGWTLPQIAERTGRSVPAVASLLRRGLAELRTRLKPGGNP